MGSQALDSTTLNTTLAAVVKASATWSVAHADNQVRQDTLFVEVLREM